MNDSSPTKIKKQISKTVTQIQRKTKLQKPDSSVIGAINSMRKNPDFAKLLQFAISCLRPGVTPPNSKIRDNQMYIILEGGHNLLLKAFSDHGEKDFLVQQILLIFCKMIGIDKYRNPEVIRSILEAGALETIVKVLQLPIKRSKKTVLAFINLVSMLEKDVNAINKMIYQGIFETMLKVLDVNCCPSLKDNEIKQGLDVLLKIANYQMASYALEQKAGIVADLFKFLDSHSKSPSILGSGLQLIEKFCKFDQAIQICKEDDNYIKILLRLMEQHPSERELLSNGAIILSKIATKAHLHQALENLQQEEENDMTEFNTALLCQMMLVDEWMNEIIQMGGVELLIKLIKRTVKKTTLSENDFRMMQHCITALGRIVEQNESHLSEVMKNSGFSVIKETMEVQPLSIKQQQDNQVQQNQNSGMEGSQDINITFLISQLNTFGKFCNVRESETVIDLYIKLQIVPLLLARISLYLNFESEAGQALTNIVNSNQFTPSQQNLAEASVGFLLRLEMKSSDEQQEKLAAQNSILFTCINILKNYSHCQPILWQSFKLLNILMISESVALRLIKEGIIEVLLEASKLHSNWRRFAKVKLKKNSDTIDAVISLMSGQNLFDLTKNHFQAEQEEPEIDEENEGGDLGQGSADVSLIGSGEQGLQETIGQQQEDELQEIAKQILYSLVDIDTMNIYKVKLQQALLRFTATPDDAKFQMDLIQLITIIRFLTKVRQFGEICLLNGTLETLLQFTDSQLINGLKFKNLERGIGRYSYIIHQFLQVFIDALLLGDVLLKKNIEFGSRVQSENDFVDKTLKAVQKYENLLIYQRFFCFQNDLLQKSLSQISILSGLRSFKQFLDLQLDNQQSMVPTTSILSSGNDNVDSESAEQGIQSQLQLQLQASPVSQQTMSSNNSVIYDNIQKFIESLIEGIIKNMKKYTHVDSLQLIAIEVFNLLNMFMPQIIEQFLKMGGSRCVIQELSETQNKEVGMQCLKLLSTIANSNQNNLQFLINQNVTQSIMSFLQLYRNEKSISEIASKLLMQLSSTGDSANACLSQELLSDLDETIKQFVAVSTDLSPFNRKEAMACVDVLSTYSLIQKALEIIAESKVPETIIVILRHESRQEMHLLAEIGDLHNYYKLFIGQLMLMSSICQNGQAALQFRIFSRIQDICEMVVYTIIHQIYSDMILHTFLLLNTLLNSLETQNILLQQCISQGIINSLIAKLEQFQGNYKIITIIFDLLCNLIKFSPEVADTLDCTEYVNVLLKQIRSLQKQREITQEQEEESHQIRKALICVIENLGALASIQKIAEVIIDQKGFELILHILQFEKKNVKCIIAPEEMLFTLNLITNEQKSLQNDDPDLYSTQILLHRLVLLLNRLSQHLQQVPPDMFKDIVNVFLTIFQNNQQVKMLQQIINTVINKKILSGQIDNENLIDCLSICLNEHILDQEIESNAGRLFSQCANNMLDAIMDVMGQYELLQKDLQNNDPQNIIKANIYFSNMLVTELSRLGQDAVNASHIVIVSLQDMLKLVLTDDAQSSQQQQSKNNDKSMVIASALLLVIRLASIDENIKIKIVNSEIPAIVLTKLFVGNNEFMKPEAGMISALALRSLNCLLEQKNQDISQADSVTGDDINVQNGKQQLNLDLDINDIGNGSPSIQQQTKIQPYFVSEQNNQIAQLIILLNTELRNNDFALMAQISIMAKILPSSNQNLNQTPYQQYSMQTQEQSIQLLTKLCQLFPQVQQEFNEKHQCYEKIKAIYVGYQNQFQNAMLPFYQISKLVSILDSQLMKRLNQEVNFAQNVLTFINDITFDDIQSQQKGLQMVGAVECLSLLIQFGLNKNEIIEANIPAILTSLIKKLNLFSADRFLSSNINVSTQTSLGGLSIENGLQHLMNVTMKTLKILVHRDIIINRIMQQNSSVFVLELTLAKLAFVCKLQEAQSDYFKRSYNNKKGSLQYQKNSNLEEINIQENNNQSEQQQFPSIEEQMSLSRNMTKSQVLRFQQSTRIVVTGQQGKNIQSLEFLLSSLSEITNSQKFIKILELFQNEGQTAQAQRSNSFLERQQTQQNNELEIASTQRYFMNIFLDLLEHMQDNCYIIVKIQKMLENALQQFTISNIKQEQIEKLLLLSAKLANQYKTVLFIVSFHAKIQKFCVTELDEEQNRDSIINKQSQQQASSDQQQQSLNQSQRKSERKGSISLDEEAAGLYRVQKRQSEALNIMDMIQDTLAHIKELLLNDKQIPMVTYNLSKTVIEKMNGLTQTNLKMLRELHNLGASEQMLELYQLTFMTQQQDEMQQTIIEYLMRITKQDKLFEKASDNLLKYIALILAQRFQQLAQAPPGLSQMVQKQMIFQTLNNIPNTQQFVSFFQPQGIQSIVVIIRNNKDYPQVLPQYICSLAKFIIDEKSVHAFIEAQGCQVMADAFEAQIKKEEVVQPIMEVIDKLGIHPEAQNAMAEAHLEKAFLKGINAPPKKIELLAQYYKALGNMVWNHPQNVQNIAQADCLSNTKKLLTSKKNESADLVGAISRFFGNLCHGNSQMKQNLGAQGILEIIRAQFKIYARKPDLSQESNDQRDSCVIYILNSIAEICNLNFENVSLLAKSDFILSACAFIQEREKKNSETAVNSVLKCFTIFSSFPQSLNKQNLLLMQKQNIVETLVSVLVNNQLKPQLIQNTLITLQQINRNRSLRDDLTKKGCAVLLLQIIKISDSYAMIVEISLNLLSDLSINTQNIQTLIQKNVYQMIFDILQLHIENKNVFIEAIKLLTIICTNDNQKNTNITQRDFIDIAIEMLDTEHENQISDTGTQVLTVLSNLSYRWEGMAQQICQKGCVGILQASRASMLNQKIIECAINLLVNITYFKCNANLFFSLEGIELIIEILEKHSSNEAILVKGLLVISQLCRVSEPARQKCIELNITKFLTSLHDLKKGFSDVQFGCRWAIFNITNKHSDFPPRILNLFKPVVQKVWHVLTVPVDMTERKYLSRNTLCRVFKVKEATVERVIFFNDQFNELQIRLPNSDDLKKKWRMHLSSIIEVKHDFDIDQEAYKESPFSKSGIFKKKANANLCVMIVGQENSFYLEFKSIEEKEKWLKNFNVVFEFYIKQGHQIKEAGNETNLGDGDTQQQQLKSRPPSIQSQKVQTKSFTNK